MWGLGSGVWSVGNPKPMRGCDNTFVVRDVVLQLNFKGEERKRWGEEGERGSRLIGEGLKRKMLPTDLHGLARIEKG